MFDGKKAGRLVAVGPIESYASKFYIGEVLKSCERYGIKRADILGFGFEMGAEVQIQEAKRRGIDISLEALFLRRCVMRRQ